MILCTVSFILEKERNKPLRKKERETLVNFRKLLKDHQNSR